MTKFMDWFKKYVVYHPPERVVHYMRTARGPVQWVTQAAKRGVSVAPFDLHSSVPGTLIIRQEIYSGDCEAFMKLDNRYICVSLEEALKVIPKDTWPTSVRD